MFYRKLSDELVQWKNNPTRKPLIIRGARQVGKTTLVHQFGETYKQYIYLNLEKEENKQLFTKITDVNKLSKQIFFNHKLKWELRAETLLFIDEIQEVPKAVNILRYFKEELSELHVIAAGSMLETLLGKNISFPVGRVEFKILRPVSFEEFLVATKEELALEELKNIPLNDYAHNRLLDLFHTYAFLGGMPEIIEEYAKSNDITRLRNKYESLLNSYLDDAEKYATSFEQLQMIRLIIEQAWSETGSRITFNNFGNTAYKSKEVGEILRTLQKTHLFQLVYPTVTTDLPILKDYKKKPRLQCLDTGLLNFSAGLQLEILKTDDLNKVYKGKMIEHLVGQEIIAHQSAPQSQLNFWTREKNSSDAEIDFIIPYASKLVPIEVKSGATGKLKSLLLYLDQAKINYGVRCYAGELSYNTLITPKGKEILLLNLPYFLAGQIENYLPILAEKAAALPEKREDYFEEEKTPYQTKKKIVKTYDEHSLLKEHVAILKACHRSAKNSKYLLEEVIFKNYQSRNKREFIQPLFELGFIEWTQPENPKSKKQAYKITQKGNDFLTHN